MPSDFYTVAWEGGSNKKQMVHKEDRKKLQNLLPGKKYPKLFCLILIKFQGKQLVFKPHQSGNASFQLCTLQI